MPESSITIRVTTKDVGKIDEVTKAVFGLTKAFEKGQRSAGDFQKSLSGLNTDKQQKQMQGLDKQLSSVDQSLKGIGKNKLKLTPMTKELESVTKEAAKTDQALSDVADSIQKTEHGSNAIGKALKEMGVAGQLAGTTTNVVGTFVGSAYGTQTGNAVAGVLSSTISGALTGGIPGAIASGMMAVVNAITANFAAKNEEFKSYYKSLYDTTQANHAAGVSGGIQTKNEQAELLRTLSKTEKIDTTHIDSLSKTLLVSQEDIYTAISAYTGKEKEEVKTLLADGRLQGKEFTEAVINYFSEEVGGIETYIAYAAAKEEREQGEKRVEAAYGEGYAQERQYGNQEMADHLNSAAGSGKEEANRMVATAQAIEENGNDRRRINAEAFLYGGGMEELAQASFQDRGWLLNTRKEMEEAQNRFAEGEALGDESMMASAGNQMGVLQKELELFLSESNDSSEYAEMRKDADDRLIDAARDLAERFENWKYQYNVEQKWTVGLNVFAGQATGNVAMQGANNFSMGLAWGLDRVPYDNFPALLHEGERVLTASEARAADRLEESVSVQVAGNQFVIREEADIGRVAAALADQIKAARMGGVYQHA